MADWTSSSASYMMTIDVLVPSHVLLKQPKPRHNLQNWWHPMFKTESLCPFQLANEGRATVPPALRNIYLQEARAAFRASGESLGQL